MRTLTSTLLAAQKQDTRTPAVRVQARNLLNGVVNLKWARLYAGPEPEGPHALTIPADGSLIRLRATPPADGRKLYRQRVTNPGPGSDFSPWAYLNQYNVMAVAACALGAEVSIFWLKSNAEIVCSKSVDNGASWQATDYPGYAPTGTGVTAAAAAYKPGGDLALFFTDTAALYVIKLISGVWQARTAWNKTAGSLSGVAAVYDGDWKLLVTGTDASGNYKLWSLIYGDGEEAAAGAWSALKEIASSPPGEGYEYRGVFLDKRDPLSGEGQGTSTYRCFFTEKYSGTEAYNRPFRAHTISGAPFPDNRWREPVPFDASGENGLAMAHTSSYAWRSSTNGVWRAGLVEETRDISQDVIALSLKLKAESGELVIELNNDRGQYSQLPDSPFNSGCRIDFSPGYRTSEGDEYSDGLGFILEACEHTSAPGKATLVLYTADGWQALEKWIARYQLRWNQTPGEASVTEIIAQLLARAGMKLAVISQSSAAAGFYPGFTVHPGDNGKETIKRLLSFIPDILFLEGSTAYLVNPLAADAAVYNYVSQGGIAEHVIMEGRYRSGAREINRVKVEGPGVLADSFAWDEIEQQGDNLQLIDDLNLTTSASAHDRAEAILLKAEIASINGYLKIPVNCGQQLYDVVAITDPAAGLSDAKRRVLGMDLIYLPAKAIYQQKLILGGV